jgi:hypothetical protein
MLQRAQRAAAEDLLLSHIGTTNLRKSRSSARYARIRMTGHRPETMLASFAAMLAEITGP